MLADPCADPGISPGWSRPENSSDNGFCPQILQFYSGFSMVYFKENYNFTRFRGGGVSNLFRGVQMLILETHRTFDFPGGGADPISPSGTAHVTI